MLLSLPGLPGRAIPLLHPKPDESLAGQTDRTDSPLLGRSTVPLSADPLPGAAAAELAERPERLDGGRLSGFFQNGQTLPDLPDWPDWVTGQAGQRGFGACVSYLAALRCCPLGVFPGSSETSLEGIFGKHRLVDGPGMRCRSTARARPSLQKRARAVVPVWHRQSARSGWSAWAFLFVLPPRSCRAFLSSACQVQRRNACPPERLGVWTAEAPGSLTAWKRGTFCRDLEDCKETSCHRTLKKRPWPCLCRVFPLPPSSGKKGAQQVFAPCLAWGQGVPGFGQGVRSVGLCLVSCSGVVVKAAPALPLILNACGLARGQAGHRFLDLPWKLRSCEEWGKATPSWLGNLGERDDRGHGPWTAP